MAMKKFIELFERKLEEHHKFSFEELQIEINQLTPNKKLEKINLNFDQDDLWVMDHSKEVVIRNFCMNPFIQKYPLFDLVNMTGLFEFLKDEHYSEILLAKALFLVHISKADFLKMAHREATILLNTFLTQFSTISPIVDKGFESNDFKSIFQIIVKSTSIKKILNKQIDQIIENDGNFPFEKVELIFLECSSLPFVRGFAGKYKVYVNIIPIIDILQKIKINYTNKLLIAKIEFIRLIIHEISHIMIRERCNDLNSSSPFLMKANPKAFKNVAECGLEIEKVFFQELIDWEKSIEAGVIDFNYCQEFLDNFLQNERIEFNSCKTGFKTRDPNESLNMGFDLVLPKLSFCVC